MISIPDLINGMFEFCGSLAIFGHCRQILKDKMVKGVSWPAVLFFTAWGWWNAIVYYPHLSQWLSFFGGLGIVIANTVWLILLLKYKNKSQENISTFSQNPTYFDKPTYEAWIKELSTPYNDDAEFDSES